MKRLLLEIGLAVCAPLLVSGLVLVLLPLFFTREMNHHDRMRGGGVLEVLAAVLEESPPEQVAERFAALRPKLNERVELLPASTVPPKEGRGGPPGPPPFFFPFQEPPRHAIYRRLEGERGWLREQPPPRPPRPPQTPQLALGGTLVLAFLATLLLGARLRRRLLALEAASSRLSSGDLTARVGLPAGDPLEPVGRSFDAMAAQLERLLAEREGLLQAVAHELGTPLSRIRLGIELLRAEGTEGPAERRLAALEEDLGELDDLAAELTAWLEADSAARQPPRALLAECLGTLVEFLREESSTAIELRLEPGLAVLADPRQFQRVAENLIRNALRHCRTRVVIEARECAGSVCLEVRDDGPGIPAADRERVFEPFVRLNPSRDRSTGGTGLGLAIAQRLALRYGGSIVVADAPEGGTCMRSTWPSASAAPPR